MLTARYSGQAAIQLDRERFRTVAAGMRVRLNRLHMQRVCLLAPVNLPGDHQLHNYQCTV